MPNPGFADVVIGLQYGDEGKARVVDMIASSYDIIARFNGGANAGHTIETEDGVKVALNQVPSGIFYKEKMLYTGSGCVVDFDKLAKEIANLEKIGISLSGRYHISPQATVVQPHHLLLDGATGRSVGTTNKGIGPAYADRAYRMLGNQLKHIRVGDVLDNPEAMLEAMRENLREAGDRFGLQCENPEEWIEVVRSGFEAIRDYIQEDPLFLEKQVRSGKNVLFEGAQSVMLDVSKGYVPYVTSSLTTAGAAYSGGDLPPKYHRKTIGIVKAVMSRVGHGPFPSEFGGRRSEDYCMKANPDGSPAYGRPVEGQYDVDALMRSSDEFEMGKGMRILSGEYGTVSTRPRRVGALDLALLNYTVGMNAVDELFITKCDLLREYSRTEDGLMPLCVAYELGGKRIDYVPGTTGAYYEAKPIIERMPGFSEDISNMRKPEELPPALKDFLSRIERDSGVKVIGIGTGPKRDQVVNF